MLLFLFRHGLVAITAHVMAVEEGWGSGDVYSGDSHN